MTDPRLRGAARIWAAALVTEAGWLAFLAWLAWRAAR